MELPRLLDGARFVATEAFSSYQGPGHAGQSEGRQKPGGREGGGDESGDGSFEEIMSNQGRASDTSICPAID